MRLKTFPFALLLVLTLSAFPWLHGAAALDAEWTRPPRLTDLAGVVQTVGGDHPVGMPLAGFSGAGGGSNDQIAGLNLAVINGEQVWWIDMEEVPNHQRDETDLILYTQQEAGQPLPYVECATCHDPNAGDESVLRTSNRGSRVCRACHPY